MGMMDAVILTKSRMTKFGTKKYGFCVTAYDFAERRFVRFVEDVAGSPIPCECSNCFNVLDRVRVNVIRPCPLGPQTENLLVDTRSFSRVGHYDYGIAALFHAAPSPNPPLFMERNGHKLRSVAAYDHSIELIPVTDLCIEDENGKGKASFRREMIEYHRFSVTDTKFNMQNNVYPLWIGDAYLVITIPTEEYIRDETPLGYFKFVSAIYQT